MRLRTVGEVAELTGVTVRALHHYDEIGLLSPSERTAAGYRLYSDADLVRLHAIVNWRDMGFGLTDIAGMLDDQGDDVSTALKRQRERLLDRADRLGAMIEALEAAIDAHDRGMTMNDDTVIEIFDGFDPTEHEDEAHRRWGDTDAYVESRRRASEYSADDWKRFKRQNQENLDDFISMMKAGSPPDSPEAQEAARRHGALIDEWFYPITPEIHLGLAESYVTDPRFEATYETAATGLARYIRDAIVALHD